MWDTINNANISVENHVHSYTTKSDVVKTPTATETTKSDVGKSTENSARRDVWDLIKGANISVVNSVHSVQVTKKCTKGNCPKVHAVSSFHGSKSHHDEVALRRSSIIVGKSQKRDEEPGEDSGPDPVAVRGKSPSDVAGERISVYFKFSK